MTLGSGTGFEILGQGDDPTGTVRIGGNVTGDHCLIGTLGAGVEFRTPNPAVVVGGNVLIQYCQREGIEVDNLEVGGNLTCNSNTVCSLKFSNIKGNVQSNNNGFSDVFDNTVGGNVEVDNNGFSEIGANTIGGNLQCQGNTSIIGSVNMVGGHKTGQCANF